MESGGILKVIRGFPNGTASAASRLPSQTLHPSWNLPWQRFTTLRKGNCSTISATSVPAAEMLPRTRLHHCGMKRLDSASTLAQGPR
ncbi:unnamed protein product [Cladocopium goreaui]|uniref:Uncharacterized protein n=1 Tax=Cladocopium goreaui TaxID=2562237 RepID=A0A9P1FRH6_9DINO|nr:unnamed protein product [Cladocopium goreaui]